MEEIANDVEKQTDFTMENSGTVQKDFIADDLCILKAMFLELEKAIDAINIVKRDEGDTYSGGYIFELLEKAQVNNNNFLHLVISNCWCR